MGIMAFTCKSLSMYDALEYALLDTRGCGKQSGGGRGVLGRSLRVSHMSSPSLVFCITHTVVCSYNHSGTYPNQWMVLNLDLFAPGGSPLQRGLFTVFEEVPGHSSSADLTDQVGAIIS